MTIGIPASRGSAQSAVAANSLAVTLTSSIAIGSHLILVFGNSGATGLSINSVVDSKGNSWAVDKYQGDNNSTGAYSGIASAKITTALTTSDTVTFTVSASVTHRMSLLYEVTGLDPTTWVDQTTGAPGTGTSPASGTINTTSANELIMGACGWDSGTANSHASIAPMTELDEIHTTGKGIAASYNLVSVTGGYSDSGTITSALWSDCVVSYIAANVPPAITETDLTAGADTTDQDTYITASITPSANKLQLISIENAKSTLDAPSVAGCNLTWVAIANVSYNQIVGPSKTITILRAMGASPTTGTLTITFGGVLQNGCLWSVAEFDGIDTSGTNGSGAIVQSATNRSDAAASLTATLAAFGAPYNVAYGAFGCISAPVLQAGTGYTAVNSNQAIATPTLNLFTEWRINNLLVNATVASGTPDMGAVAIEIKASTTFPVTNRSVTVGANVGIKLATSGSLTFGTGE